MLSKMSGYAKCSHEINDLPFSIKDGETLRKKKIWFQVNIISKKHLIAKTKLKTKLKYYKNKIYKNFHENEMLN